MAGRTACPQLSAADAIDWSRKMHVSESQSIVQRAITEVDRSPSSRLTASRPDSLLELPEGRLVRNGFRGG